MNGWNISFQKTMLRHKTEIYGVTIMNEQLPLLISFSGGKTSGLMTRILCDYYSTREKVVIFSNTGKEREETLDFVNQCDQRWGLNVVWLEALVSPEKGVGTRHKVVDFGSASRQGEPFEAVIAKYGIPNLSFPHCTRELKIQTIHSYVKNHLGWKEYETAIGIRADEQHRINWNQAKLKRYVYPMATDFVLDKKAVNAWWEGQDFTLHLLEEEGNCDLCWKKSDKKLVRIIRRTKHLLEWWDEMERKYSSVKTPLTPAYFFRKNRSAKEMLALAEEVSLQTSLFDALDEAEYDCFCKA